MTKFTPGPWAVFEHRGHSGLEVGPPYSDTEYNGALKGNVKAVCTIRGYRSFYPYDCSDEQRANARLIAAAPELFALLIEMESELKPGPTGGNDYHDAWRVFGEKIQSAIAKTEGK